MAERQKKLTIRNSALFTGLRRVIIIIADATAATAKKMVKIFSNVKAKRRIFINL